MKVINLPRQHGKTTRLLYASEFNDAPILCATFNSKKFLLDRAHDLKLNIPEPITVSELTSGRLRETKIIDKDILVDEVPMVLQFLLYALGMTGEIKAITLTEKDGVK